MLQAPEADINQLAALTAPNDRVQFVGNAIYASIETVYKEEAGKITGMLLDEKVVDFTKLLRDPVYLSQKAYDAVALIM